AGRWSSWIRLAGGGAGGYAGGQAGVGGPAELGRRATAPCETAAERFDPAERRRDVGCGEVAARQRGCDAFDGLAGGVEREADEQHVAASGQRCGGGAGGGVVAGDGAHLQVVAEEDAAEAEPTPQEAAGDERRQGRGSTSVEGREEHVRGHEGGKPGAD